MNDLSPVAVVRMESAPGPHDHPAASKDHSTPLPVERPMSAFGQLLFDQARILNEAQRSMLMEGRRQFSRDVTGIIGTLSIHKPPMRVIDELIALCRKEAA